MKVAETRMDEARFWAIIETGDRKALADPERQLAAIRKQLCKECDRYQRRPANRR